MRERKRERPVAESAGLGFRQRHQLGNCPHLERTVGDERQRVEKQKADRLEILLGVEWEALERELIVDHRLARKHADGVAVRRSLRARPRADVQCAAGPVLHHDRLMQRPRQLISERPGEHISPSAGAERDDDPEGTGGIVLGRRARTHGERNDGEDRGDEKSRHDLPPIFVFLWRIGRRPSRRKAHGNVWHDRIDLVACGGGACTHKSTTLMMSAWPPQAVQKRRFPNRRFVPIADTCAAAPVALPTIYLNRSKRLLSRKEDWRLTSLTRAGMRYCSDAT